MPTDHYANPFVRRFRLIRAYGVTGTVLMSYLTHRIAGVVRGPDWKARALPALHRRNARRVMRLILDLKGLFIKVGQLISILTNVLPEVFRHELEGLQDRVPPVPLEEINDRIRTEWGKDPSDLFASFEPEPLASASLAQVHEARLHDGRRVAVKVQYRDIETTAEMDLRTIRRLLSFVGTIIRLRGLTDQYRQLEAMIRDELDFEAEARHIEAIAANFDDVPGVAFPDVVHDRSTRRVLTTEFIDGTKVSDLTALKDLGVDREALAERIVAAYCRMIFSDGFYHADPHPGNLIVRPDGALVFIDFGAVARLSPGMKAGIPQFLMGLLRRDQERIMKAFRQMGLTAKNGHDETIARLIDYVHEHVVSDLSLEDWQLKDLDAASLMQKKVEMIFDLRKLDIAFRELTDTFQVPKDLILLARTTVLLMGLCTHLSPEMNPVRVIRPYIEEAVLGPEKDWKKLVGGAVKELALSAVALPDELHRVLAKAIHGELMVQSPQVQAAGRLRYALGHQVIFAMLALGSGGLAYLARLNADPSFATIFAMAAGFFATLMAGSMWRVRRASRQDR